MLKLTDAQRAVLSEAAGAEGDIPRGHHAPTTIAALIKRGLLLSIPVTEGPSRLSLTHVGRDAIGARDPAATARIAPDPCSPGPKGKIGALVALMERPQGATIADMMAATGWQAHSVRGAIAGSIKKSLGLGVESEKTEAGRVYRLTAEVRR